MLRGQCPLLLPGPQKILVAPGDQVSAGAEDAALGEAAQGGSGEKKNRHSVFSFSINFWQWCSLPP